MAAPTYLQLVNEVLVNLRESVVSTVNVSYSQLVGAFVNKAKEKVEDATAWSTLTVAATITTASGNQIFALDGTGTAVFSPNRALTDRSTIIRDSRFKASVFSTSGSVISRLREYNYEDLVAELRVTSPITNQPPCGFAFTQVAGVPTLVLSRPVDGVYTIEARFSNPQPILSTDTDTMFCPRAPVVSLATYFAMQERGEELGANADMYLSWFQDELARNVTNNQEGEPLEFRND